MAIDWKTGALAVGAVAIWGVFFALTHDDRPAEAKKLVAASLRDPASAQFRDVKKSDQAVCGEVDGKNAFGAYVGFRHFIVEGGSADLEPETPREPLQPGVSMGVIEQWNATTAFRANWTSKCPSPLPELPAGLDPIIPGITP
ncbi:hypothetical protein [Caulobacter sp.]|uniref:hypothetical protein n=1 Tax=Caulobacter sp. TaxID=78 RepID=UPI001B09FEB9|nr:hypothetical protein [Caulobacter sp.]MBO9545783.1 hypothetical protein [Caulobacter sp.]